MYWRLSVAGSDNFPEHFAPTESTLQLFHFQSFQQDQWGFPVLPKKKLLFHSKRWNELEPLANFRSFQFNTSKSFLRKIIQKTKFVIHFEKFVGKLLTFCKQPKCLIDDNCPTTTPIKIGWIECNWQLLKLIFTPDLRSIGPVSRIDPVELKRNEIAGNFWWIELKLLSEGLVDFFSPHKSINQARPLGRIAANAMDPKAKIISNNRGQLFRFSARIGQVGEKTDIFFNLFDELQLLKYLNQLIKSISVANMLTHTRLGEKYPCMNAHFLFLQLKLIVWWSHSKDLQIFKTFKWEQSPLDAEWIMNNNQPSNLSCGSARKSAGEGGDGMREISIKKKGVQP